MLKKTRAMTKHTPTKQLNSKEGTKTMIKKSTRKTTIKGKITEKAASITAEAKKLRQAMAELRKESAKKVKSLNAMAKTKITEAKKAGYDQGFKAAMNEVSKKNAARDKAIANAMKKIEKKFSKLKTDGKKSKVATAKKEKKSSGKGRVSNKKATTV